MLQGNPGNRLLRELNPEELAILQPHLQQISVSRGTVLVDAAQTASHLFFPETALLCLVGATEGGSTIEVALVGPEGVALVSAALGNQRSPFRVVGQLDGTVWRVPTDLVNRELHRCRQLHERFLSYSHQVIAQVGQSAICNRFHTSKQRLARWLLTTADRVNLQQLPLTHEFIAHMVGGPRSAVTEAAAALRASGAIEYTRGRITITDAQRLRHQACECYEATQDSAVALTKGAGTPAL
jgi:CRP-like cAMP-binding protein